MKRNIVIVEPVSTGFNLIDDVKARGHQPVVMFSPAAGSDEDRENIEQLKAMFKARMPKDVPVIDNNPDYDKLLDEVRRYDPLLVIAGSEFGVELAARLASVLGLRGNRWANIRKMTQKDEMHQALADAGVRCGLTKADALEMAAQTVYGSAKMVLEGGEHPAILKDRVCSPGGTTIEGVAALEKEGFKNAVLEGCAAVYRKCSGK